MRQIASAVGPLVAFALFAGAACTSSSTGNTSSANGAGSFCSALSSYATRCQLTSACDQVTVSTCPALATTFSNAYLDAVTECLPSVLCGDAGESSANACFNTSLGSAAPTAADQKLAEDYCAACASILGEPSCVTEFTSASLDAAAGVAAQVGTSVVIFSDALLEKVDTSCIAGLADGGGLPGCTEIFQECAFNIQEAAEPATPACNTSENAEAGTVTAG